MRLGPHRLFAARTTSEKAACALDVIRWGYFRPFEPGEILHCVWFRYGPAAVFWFEWNDREKGELILHLCIEPDRRGAIYPRRWWAATTSFAEVLSARRLVHLGNPPSGPVAAMLVRLGWTPHVEGLAYELGEFEDDDGHTEGSEGAEAG